MSRMTGAFSHRKSVRTRHDLIIGYALILTVYALSAASAHGYRICMALLRLVYIAGDSADYPISDLYDWGEAFLKFGLLYHSMMQVLFTARSGEMIGGGTP